MAVSIGFASKISEIGFLSSLTRPSTNEIHQLILLILAMCVVIGSWEFYFSSVSKRPLIDRSRFYVDIAIVSLYILLLLAAKNFEVFLFYFMDVMIFYVVWDTLTMRIYPTQYGIPTFTFKNLLHVYMKGIRWRTGSGIIKSTPVISVWWTIIFVVVFLYHFNNPINFYVGVTINASIYILYRADQRIQLGMVWRLASFAAIVALYSGSRWAGFG